MCVGHIEGWLGARVAANEAHRLLVVDTEPLLAGFRKQPGSHPWIGEHVGKWMHAATLAWANSGDAALREKLDRVAAELIAAQEADGYLGTYECCQSLVTPSPTPGVSYGVSRVAELPTRDRSDHTVCPA